MTRCLIAFAILIAIHLGGPDGAGAGEKASANWPAFRGEAACGIAEGFSLPSEWDVKKKGAVRWSKKVPGLGHSCPVIWGDKLFITTAVSARGRHSLKSGLYGDVASVEDDSVHVWWLYCFDKRSGKVLWKEKACKGVPRIKRHTKATHANSTPATDGQHVVAFFGSEGLHCYDMNGKKVWSQDLGTLDAGWYVSPEAQWEFGSSPIIYDGKVIIQCDVQKDSFIRALSVKDGKQLWTTSRTEVPTWGTPTVHVAGGQAQLIANGWKHIGGYDLATGKEIWKLRGGGDIPVPTPIVAHDLIFITNAHGQHAPIYAIKTSATGDITVPLERDSGPHIAWQTARKGNYMQTPIVYGDYLYCCRDNGVMACFEAKTGKEAYTQRLGSGISGFTASAVAGDGKLYFTSEEGDVYVLKAGPKYELLSKSSLGDGCLATPAISAGTIFFRTQGKLICVSEQNSKGQGAKKSKRAAGG